MGRLFLLLLFVAAPGWAQAAGAKLRPSAPPAAAKNTSMTLSPPPGQSNITSWNAWSRQFIDPPVFRLLAAPQAGAYRATLTQGEKTWRVESAQPRLSLEGFWAAVKAGKFTLTFEWLGAAGRVLGRETSPRLKRPEWPGFDEAPADWAAAADRNMAYLIDTAWNGRAPFKEAGVPIIIWSIASPTNPHAHEVQEPGNRVLPNGYALGYPCLAIGNYVPAFLACARRGGPQAAEALRLARACADWALKNHYPNEGALPRFPYSTVNNGKIGGGVDGPNVNAMRAGELGVAFAGLYQVTGQTEYLDYARHIADTLIKLQRSDGSFPYRVSPKTGAVADDYAPEAVQLALLVDALEPYGFSRARRVAAQRAIDWMVAYVCATNHWQGAFEDVGRQPPYRNLTQRQAFNTIRYLCRHRAEDPSYLPAARKLNRWIEDQFVMFAPSSWTWTNAPTAKVHGPVKTPVVFEQFAWWHPLEGHTADWLGALLELHRATGDREYLDKARAAGNAICATQFTNGAFSTWGARHYDEKGKLVPDEDPGFNWYNCNARADRGLYELDAYTRALK